MGSDDPAIRYRLLVRVLGEDPRSRAIEALQQEIRRSARAQSLLTGQDANGRLNSGRNVYAKWQGAHWVLATLADMGYPSRDELLTQIGEQILDFWLQDDFYREFEADTRAAAYRKSGVPVMQGRHRRCGSQQGNALYFLTKLGIAGRRADHLVERLLHWQWPDGGWNCDKNPVAATSSFTETLLPMRGLGLYGRERNDAGALAAALRAAEVFLTRRLFIRRSNGQLIHPEFMQFHYPLYWHYDILGALKGMAEVGMVNDPRCSDALDVLERKELPGGGWSAEKRYYKVANDVELNAEYVDWGGTSQTRLNEWVTTDALYVLREAGRI
jgi:hypothetical protein